MNAKKRFYTLFWFFIFVIWLMLGALNVSFAGFGWSNPKVTNVVNAGLTVDATITTEKRGSDTNTKVVTTNKVITVKGNHPIFIGKKCSIILYENRQPDLCVDGEVFCWEIIKGN